MKKKADLLVFSKYSRGSLEIDDIVSLALKRNVKTVSITDSNTFGGSARANILGRKRGLDIIPSLEIFSFDKILNDCPHLVCYYPKDLNILQNALKKIIFALKERSELIIKEVLLECKIPMRIIKKRFESSPCLYISHIIKTLIDTGYLNDFDDDIYKKFSQTNKYLLNVEENFPNTLDLISNIHRAKGIAAIVSCNKMFRNNRHQEVIDLIERAAKSGLDALQTWHPDYSEKQEKALLDIADKYNLLKIGGTEFCGSFSTSPNPIGTCYTPYEEIIKIQTMKRMRHGETPL
ncbi:MAG: hypothetical protein LBF33_00915 [Oscillospiraceae bacterium]|jgi:predicted metal-dependent phosphoesterase TrpH|nr:hypothetical protein [Oscillospiraceae bacterium]